MSAAHRALALALLGVLYLVAIGSAVQLVATPKPDAMLGNLAAMAIAVKALFALAFVVCVAGAATVHAILARP